MAVSGCCGSRKGERLYIAEYGDGLAQESHLFPDGLRGYCSTASGKKQEKTVPHRRRLFDGQVLLSFIMRPWGSSLASTR